MDISGRKVRIGWIGTGVMGTSMCRHLMTAGFETTIYNRTRASAEPLLAEGAAWADTPAEAAEISDIVFTIVGLPEDVEQVYFHENGLLEGAVSGSILVDMTTTSPSLAREIYEKAARNGVSTVDAPVSGGDIGARNAALSIMVGGDRDVVDNIMPLLEIMGKNIIYQGPAGSGQHTKMCNQIMVAGEMIGVCESLLYSYKAGLDPETVLKSISKGAAACWALDNLASRIIKEDYAPGFYVDHFVKDMGIALDEAERMNLTLPGLDLVHKLYTRLQELGHGKSGTQALILALDNMTK